MSMKQIATDRRTRIQKEIDAIDTEIASAPEGKLAIYRCQNNKLRFFQIIPQSKEISNSTAHGSSRLPRKKEYLNRHNKELIQDLAYKALISARKKDLQEERDAIDNYLACLYHATNEKDLIEKEPLLVSLVGMRRKAHYTPLADELEEWRNEPYLRNPKYAEYLTVPTLNGYSVRSKSESMIDTLLTKYNIPFRYESSLLINSVTYYPDFTIRHPKTGNIYIWEHFGRMDDLRYVQMNLPKLQKFAKEGFILGKNLILTCETETIPLDIQYAEDIIKYYFL